MITPLIILAYLLGCIISFFLAKYLCKKIVKKWAKTDKQFFAIISVFSWYSVVAIPLGFLVVYLQNKK